MDGNLQTMLINETNNNLNEKEEAKTILTIKDLINTLTEHDKLIMAELYFCVEEASLMKKISMQL